MSALARAAIKTQTDFKEGNGASSTIQHADAFEELAADLVALAKQQRALMASAAAAHPGELTIRVDGPGASGAKRARTEYVLQG